MSDDVLVRYDPDVDFLCIKLSDKKTADADMRGDVVMGLDEAGNVVGFEIWRARERLLSEFMKFIERGGAEGKVENQR